MVARNRTAAVQVGRDVEYLRDLTVSLEEVEAVMRGDLSAQNYEQIDDALAATGLGQEEE